MKNDMVEKVVALARDVKLGKRITLNDGVVTRDDVVDLILAFNHLAVDTFNVDGIGDLLTDYPSPFVEPKIKS